jgi:hypothetical protein
MPAIDRVRIVRETDRSPPPKDGNCREGALASPDQSIPPHDGGMFWFRWNRLVGS